MPRVSQLPLASGVGTVYVIEGGVSKRVVLGGMALQSPGAVAITGGTAALSSLTTTGHVGIGDATPSWRLDVNTQSSGEQVVAGFGTSSISGGLQVSSDGNLKWRLNALNGRSLILQTNQLDRVAILADGKVGVGTSNPLALLHLNLAQLNSPSLWISRYNSETTHLLNVGEHSSAGGTPGSFGGAVFHANNRSIGFSTASLAFSSIAASDVALLIANTTNNVGVGVLSPAHRLDVGGDIGVNGTRVVAPRKTGWSAATGTATRTSFATGSVTLPQLAERVKALLDDLISHGLIGA